MHDYLNPYATALQEARSLLESKDYAGAHLRVKSILAGDPSNNEAIRLLLKIDAAKAEHRKSFSDPYGFTRYGKTVAPPKKEEYAIVLGLWLILCSICYFGDVKSIDPQNHDYSRHRRGYIGPPTKSKAMTYGILFLFAGGTTLVYGYRRIH